MDANEIEQLAAAMLRQQAEAAARTRAEQGEKDRVAAEEAAAEAARVEAVEAPKRAKAAADATERDARINAVLTAGPRDVFVDPSGVEHRVAARDDKGRVHTVGTGKGGETIIGAWGANVDNSPVSGWRKKD